MYELGTRVQSDDGAISADLAIYQIDYSDRLEPDPDQFDVLLNSGKSRHRGVELAVDGSLEPAGLDGVSYWATAAYNQSQYENGDFEGNDTPGSPHWLLGWGARYEYRRTGLFAAIDGNFVDQSYSDRENTEDINAQGTRGVRPSATLWNAHAGFRRQLSERVRLEVQVDARNIFDEEYFDVRAGRGIYPGAPFGYGASFGLTFTF
jgi:outer membrane receptor protein involved in Fe transport